MRKKLFSLVVLSFVLYSCRHDDANIITGTVSFSQTEYNIPMEDTIVLKPLFSNQALSKKKFNWTISDTGLAKILVNDSSCSLIGMSMGAVDVKITSEDNTFKTTTKVVINYPVVKKILWLGTSIPSWSLYPTIACNNLGYTCINNSVGSSGIVLTKGVGGGRDGRDLSETIAEKEARYKSYVSPEKLEEYYNMSYERAILNYIDQVQVIVFDHGYNDQTAIREDVNHTPLNFDSEDRTSFLGAFNYLVKIIKARKPSIRIIIGGYLENQSSNTVRGGKVVCGIQDSVSKHYGFPLMDVWNYTGITYDFVPNSAHYISDFNAKYGTSYTPWITDNSGNITYFQVFCPDTVHPASDFTGNSERKLDSVYTELLRSKLALN